MRVRSIAVGGTAIAAVLMTTAVHAQTGSTPSSPAEEVQDASADAAAVRARRATQAGSPRTQVVDPTGTPGTPENEIIVVGIRGSAASAVNKKRTAKQIVDSVVAEDVGKLPDNNVVEAISRITGVQITRARGQGQDVAIRGLGGVQTTVNGNNANLGTGRSLNLADIPAELVKAVDVYKTRSADQIEGSIAGTVNVELRRPLDMRKGWTLAGSARGLYDELAEKVSPFVSVLVANRLETGIGEMGFLANISWTRQTFLETYIQSESPDLICCQNDPNTAWGRLPAAQRNVIVPYVARSGVETGSVTRPSVNLAFQWAPRPELRFVVEGQYIGARERREENRLSALTREAAPTYTDIVTKEDGRTVTGIAITPNTTLANPPALPVGIDNLYSRFRNDFYQINAAMEWSGERADIKASLLHNWSSADRYNVQHLTQPRGLTRATVNFETPVGGYLVPTIELPGFDLTRLDSYGLQRFQDLTNDLSNKEYQAKVDLTLKVDEEGLLRTFQAGMWASRRQSSRSYGYRDATPTVLVNGRSTLRPFAEFPGADQATLVGPPIDGAARWLRIPGETVFGNLAEIHRYIQSVGTPATAATFSTPLPPRDRSQDFESRETVLALYGQINYGFDIGFPIDGLIGVRYVNTFGRSIGTSFTLVNNVQVLQPAVGRGNFTDILPMVTANLHFTDRTQLRLSYSTTVQRAPLADLRPFFFVNPAQAIPTVDAGNPELEAQRGHAFDISAEHYFGRGGIVSLGGFYKKATGFLYFNREPAADLAAYGLPGRSGFISQQRNGGDGEFLGLEGQAQAFFDFLPGLFRNFGASVNATHLFRARVELPFPEAFPGAYDAPATSDWTANAAIFYDTPSFSTRLAYNYRSPFRAAAWIPRPEYSLYTDATQRLDLAVNVTPVDWLTVSVEATNLTGNDVYQYFGKDNLLGSGVRLQARTVQGSVRFRF